MSDPLSGFINLLRPRAVFSRVISGAGRWGVQYSAFGKPSFAAMLDGRCRLAVKGLDPVVLEAGDFVFLPATPPFTLTSLEPGPIAPLDPKVMAAAVGEVRYGRRGGKPDVRHLGGWFEFESPDSELLVSLLPPMIHLRGLERLSTMVRLVNEEATDARVGRELVLGRLVEVLLIEALRASPAEDAPPGLLRGLADARVAVALRLMHSSPERAWTMEMLAQKAALSRSAFYDRFAKAVGMAPMEYLLAWRMAIAKEMLRREDVGIGEVAERVGYGSASTFSTAFSRHVGLAPGRYARNG